MRKLLVQCAMYVGNKNYPVGKDPIAGGKKSYGGNPPVIRDPETGVLRNRGQYDADGNLVKALPMTYEEFMNGVPGDELKCVFKDGKITDDQNFNDIKQRAKITKLDSALRLALDNLCLKVDFFQRMSSDESIAIRLAEASCGSKWSQSRPTKLAQIKSQFPQYDKAFEKLGITPSMDTGALLKHIKDNHVCDKKAKKTVFRAIGDNDVGAAESAMAGKVMITM